MKASPQESELLQLGAARFATTHWTVVLAAGHAESIQARKALETLCRTYWYPLYAFIRKQGLRPPDAEDLTQAFFVHLLGKNSLATVAREKGKFRSFLLASLINFLANERDRLGAQKRGRGQIHVPIDTTAAETRYGVEPADLWTPEKAFERHWAITLLDTVLDRLRAEYAAPDKAKLFTALKFTLTGQSQATAYIEIAAALGMSEGAIKVAVHRLRQRYRELLRDEVAQTVASPGEVDGELQHLFAVLSG